MMRWRTLGTVVVCGLAMVSGMAEATPAVEAAAEAARARAVNPAPVVRDESPVIATVGEVTVTERELQAAASRRVSGSGQTLSADERLEVLEELIADKQLLLQARALRYDETPKVQKVMVNALLREQVYAGVRSSDFSESDLRAYFEEHQSDFVVPEKREIYRIFIKSGEERSKRQARKLAKELRERAAADPSNIKYLASEHSEDLYRRRGGHLGFVSLEGKPGVPAEVFERAFELEVGEVSEAFFTDDGFNIVMVKSVRPRVERTFEQMKGAVLRKLKNEAYTAAYDAYVEAIASEFPAEIDKQALRDADLTRSSGLRPLGEREAPSSEDGTPAPDAPSE